jgi:hypothetical protein
MTSSATDTATITATSTQTNTPTITATSTVTSTPTDTWTITSTASATDTATITATSTLNSTQTETATYTPSDTSTHTPTNTGTASIATTPVVTTTATQNPSGLVIIYPNPVQASGTVNMGFNLSAPSNVIVIKLFTTGFRRVITRTFSNIPTGAFTITIDLRDQANIPLANGVYYVVVQASGQKIIKKLLIMR